MKPSQLSPKEDGDQPESEKVMIDTEKQPLSNIPSDELLDRLQNSHEVQKVVREGILLASGAAAILLQVAMPGVAKGVDNHSSFAYKPLRRLRTTLTFVYCMSFGTRDEKRALITMVNRAHADVQGPDYSANDPELQVWVASTLYASGIFMYEEVYGPMDSARADHVYREFSVLAVSLRVPSEMWPPSRKAFWKYWDSAVEKLEITPHARRVAHDLLWNKHLFLPLRMGLPVVRLMTAQMLPDSVREAYGLKTGRFQRIFYSSVILGAKIGYPAIPRFIRTIPLQFYMKDMRRRLKKRGQV
ncbi:hypothetical protein P168DRAFT_296145 [Aspergillus campestris IBT 28561]|uniref:ER-bound oxygenase mpaB/mpaB'/Rubber oxygenase catalytic domain-containing protein n=1 Tax=Aspergillus campestris (strain IBT 28561) TaxID=1392248 RepID=A0A2I1D7F5_ASPC2|nr:uncharacterized protein P168DRAFT_296145 [Aspergillus campestris IBT 28561]PKY05797.1 hypothetical protein P168DRAFT_296145 [Aspergillus campestris IBT 28561]